MFKKRKFWVKSAYWFIVVWILVYIFGTTYLNPAIPDDNLSTEFINRAFSWIIFLVGLGLFVFYYLEIGFSSTLKPPRQSKNKKEYNNEFQELERRLNERFKNLEKTNLTYHASNEVIEKAIEEKVSMEILNSFEKKYAQNAIHEINMSKIESYIESLEFNIDQYINKLSRNSSINLVIGALTTAIAVSILGVLVFEKDIDFTNENEVLAHYIPRVSISIFIEVFSFFFLRLYRANLEDVKYFENERTNIKSKILAFMTSYLDSNKDAKLLSLADLIGTERNFKLMKNESTIGLEKSRINAENDNKWLEMITKFWDSKKQDT